MSKAEERALEVFPLKIDGDSRGSYDLNLIKRIIYQQGYEQAEKDNELTWEDIEKITDIWDDLHEDETVYIKTGCDTPEFYQEVLKRFKETKD